MPGAASPSPHRYAERAARRPSCCGGGAVLARGERAAAPSAARVRTPLTHSPATATGSAPLLGTCVAI